MDITAIEIRAKQIKSRLVNGTFWQRHHGGGAPDPMKTMRAAAVREHVQRLRAEGLTFTAISQRLGVTAGRARELFLSAQRQFRMTQPRGGGMP